MEAALAVVFGSQSQARLRSRDSGSRAQSRSAGGIRLFGGIAIELRYVNDDEIKRYVDCLKNRLEGSECAPTLTPAACWSRSGSGAGAGTRPAGGLPGMTTNYKGEEPRCPR